MLAGLSRKTGSQRISRENESRFWPDNVHMIFFFFFLWGRKQNTFSRPNVSGNFMELRTTCIQIWWTSDCLQTDVSFANIVLFFFLQKNSRVYLGLLMTLNLNKRFWLCLCAVLSLVVFFNAPSWSAFPASTQAMLQDEGMAKICKESFFFASFPSLFLV